MSKEFWAHSGVEAPHLLEAHLTAVSERAALNAKRFGPAWAHLAGLWHDLGKYRPGFQTYIRQTADAHIEGKLPSRSDKSHSAAGALHATDILRRPSTLCVPAAHSPLAVGSPMSHHGEHPYH